MDQKPPDEYLVFLRRYFELVQLHILRPVPIQQYHACVLHSSLLRIAYNQREVSFELALWHLMALRQFDISEVKSDLSLMFDYFECV